MDEQQVLRRGTTPYMYMSGMSQIHRMTNYDMIGALCGCVVGYQVGVEDITDIIEGFEDEVQSVDMATMNRL